MHILVTFETESASFLQSLSDTIFLIMHICFVVMLANTGLLGAAKGNLECFIIGLDKQNVLA